MYVLPHAFGIARTGVMFLPFALGVVAGSVLAVKLGYRVAPRTLLVAGGLLTAAGFAWFGLISADGSFTTDVLGPSIVDGLTDGYTLALTPGAALLIGAVLTAATGGTGGAAARGQRRREPLRGVRGGRSRCAGSEAAGAAARGQRREEALRGVRGGGSRRCPAGVNGPTHGWGAEHP